MPMFSRNPAKQHLTDYWNALNRNAPDDELARLASLVAPAERAAIERARALHHRRRPDPAFVARLETTLMNAFPAAAQITARPSSIRQPTPAGRVAPDPVPGASTPWRSLREASGRRWQPALGIALVVLMILASLAGFWLATERNNDTHILAPSTATPATEASPDVPMYRGNAARTGVMQGPGPLGTPVELWSLQFGGSINAAPSVVDGILYIGAGSGIFSAVDAVSGEILWQYETPGVDSVAAIGDGLVLFTNADGTLHALDAATGALVWTVDGNRRGDAVAIVDGIVYTSSNDGATIALDLATGDELWRSQLTDLVARSLAVADGRVVVGTQDGIVHALDSATGDELWTFQSEGEGQLYTAAIAQGIVIQPTTEGTTNHLYALDAETGDVIWAVDAEADGGFYPVAVGDNFVYAPSADDSVYAYDLRTGEEVWNYQTGADVIAAPALVGGTLYVAGTDGFVRALDATTGSDVWSFALEGEVGYGPTVAGEVVYAGTSFGKLYAITGSGSIAALRDPAPAASLEASPAVAKDPLLPSLIWETAENVDLDDEDLGGVAVGADGVIYVADMERSVITMLGPDGSLLGEWGTPGDGPGEFKFSSPDASLGSLDIDADGNIYVFDGLNHRIQKFDANRTFITEWGSFGSNDGEFNVTGEGAVDDANNRLYVPDYLNHRVQVFDLDGTFIETWGEFGSKPGKLNTPVAVAVMPDGSVYVAEEGTRRIQHFSADGEYLGELAQPDPGYGVAYSMDVDAAGNLWTASFNPRRVVAYAPDGSVMLAFDTLPDLGDIGTPAFLAVDTQGNLILASVSGEGFEFGDHSDSRGRVIKLSISGAEVSAASPEAMPADGAAPAEEATPTG